MENGIKLNTKLSQSMNISPKLQQALKLLQLGRTDLLEAVQKELDENPALEARSTKEYSDWKPSSKGASIDSLAEKEDSLQSYVASQLRFNNLTPSQESIVLYVSGNIDPNGYLSTSYEEIAAACSVSVAEVEKVMELFKALEPAGVGARNLEECLMIQLEHIGMSDSLPGKMITKYVNELAAQNWKKIADMEKVSEEEIKSAISVIKKLEPEPGKAFSSEYTDYIKPDIFIVKDGDQYVCLINDEGLPNLKINQDFVNYASKLNKSEKSFVTSHYQSASWLIKSIEQRHKTLLAVTRAIVNYQREFLEQGDAALKPLILADIAKEVGVHESTVSRVTSNKYAQTPRGLIPLKEFFSNGLESESGLISATAIRDKIKSLFAAENSNKPLSDQEISNMLARTNIKVARRTVAKYREALGIPPASRRRNKNS